MWGSMSGSDVQGARAARGVLNSLAMPMRVRAGSTRARRISGMASGGGEKWRGSRGMADGGWGMADGGWETKAGSRRGRRHGGGGLGKKKASRHEAAREQVK